MPRSVSRWAKMPAPTVSTKLCSVLMSMEGEREALQMREQLAAQLKDGALPSNQQQAIPVVGERILSRAQGQQAEAKDIQQADPIGHRIGQIGRDPMPQWLLIDHRVDDELQWPRDRQDNDRSPNQKKRDRERRPDAES